MKKMLVLMLCLGLAMPVHANIFNSLSRVLRETRFDDWKLALITSFLWLVCESLKDRNIVVEVPLVTKTRVKGMQ
jgi:hypothetical protein